MIRVHGTRGEIGRARGLEAGWTGMAGGFFGRAAGRGGRIALVAAIAVLALICLVAEGSLATTPFTFACALIPALTLTVATRRPLFSLGLVGALLVSLALASKTKSLMMAMTLHAWDFVYFSRSPAEILFMIEHYPEEMREAGIALAAMLAFGAALLWFDPLRVRRRVAGACLGVSAAAVVLLYQILGAPDVSYFFRGRYLLSSFFISIPEAAGVMRAGGFFAARAGAGPTDAIRPGLSCPVSANYPSIVLTLNESAFPPNQFSSLAYTPALLEHFRGPDGKIHKLGVETFGGGTWLTEFNVLTGLSTWPLGNVRTYVGRLLQGRIKHALPSYLRACGYETMAFYPAPGDFVNSRPFYASLGFDHFYDAKDMKARGQERDAFYYAKALAQARAHFASSDKPLFIFIITSATHFPYDARMSPEDDIEGGGEGNSAEFNEYLRRLALGQKDHEAFRAGLAAAFPGRKFVLAHFGDHQPFIAGALQDVPDEEIATGAPDPAKLSQLYETYYKFEPLNTKLVPTPDFDKIDSPYLSTLLLLAAGVPLDDAFNARERLMRLCAGKLAGCVAAEAVGRLYRGLIEAGLLVDR